MNPRFFPGFNNDRDDGYGRRYDDYDRDYDRDRSRSRDDRYRDDYERDRDRFRDYRDDQYYRDGRRERRYDDYESRDRGYRDDFDRRDRRYDDYDRRDRPPPQPDHELYDWERKDYVPPPPVAKIDWDYKAPEPEKKEKIQIDRNVVVSLKQRAVRPAASQLPELSDAFYKINASDIIEMHKNRQYQGTFRKAGAPPKKIARCRFQFDPPFQDLSIDATFDVNEYCEELYNFLQGEVFNPDTQLRIFTPFPVTQIQNNNIKTLASFNVSGNILLTVNLKEHSFLCPKMREQYEKLKAEEKESKEKETEEKIEKVEKEEK